MARQGRLLEAMAVDELSRRRERLTEFQIKARFAMADSYDRAARTRTLKQSLEGTGDGAEAQIPDSAQGRTQDPTEQRTAQ
jgi:hypothetical protein